MDKMTIFIKSNNNICRVCKGNGKQICTSCGGTGAFSNSPFHDELGYVLGNTYVENLFETCRTCYGTGKELCKVCQGKGIIDGK